ncbi:MAG: 1-deoxy-D-xylulose-5-phosphate synthase [Selenomonadaceae bacterium]
MRQILDWIDSPRQLKELSPVELETLAMELRRFIITNVAKTGGHLAPSLGVVDLTVALHRVFNCPQDKIVWDVGHQAYAHKILTGRREQFPTLRQKDGITGFPNRGESPYDSFGVGHSSTSISAALGMAIARDLSGAKNHVIAVIGDGALTGGEAFEALNHAGDLGKKLIVILNDNEMSIERNVGAMSEYLAKIRTAPQYHRAKKDLEGILRSIPRIGDTVLKTAEHIKDSVRTFLVPGGLFEEMGFTYAGPIDGHNIRLLLEVLEQAKQMEGPVLLHVLTKKGKGYLPAEIEPDKFHGIGRFDLTTGEVQKKTGQAVSYTAVFSKTLIDLAKKNENIVAVTAAMPAGTGLKAFGEAFPERMLDVGIAEQHAVTMAAGLAAEGKRPVVALYSTFAQRAYDQILHDVCLQNLPVVFGLDRAGLVGEDGATHHGVFDFSYLRPLPHMTIMAPKDENELRRMLATALGLQGPAAVRYPRGSGLGVSLDDELIPVPVGKAEVLRKGGQVAFLAIGNMVDNALQAAVILAKSGIEATVINARFVKPLDTDLLRQLAGQMQLLVTMEENVLAGGFGSAVLEFLADAGLTKPAVLRLGLPDQFIEQGTVSQLQEMYNLSPATAAAAVQKFLEKTVGER